MHIRAVILLLGLALGAGGARADETNRWVGSYAVQKARVRVSYESVYKLAFISLFRPSRLELTLGDGVYHPPGDAPAAAARIVRIHAAPAGKKAGGTRSRGIHFESTFAAVFDAASYDLLFYEKRIEEDIAVLTFRSRRHYAQRARYFQADGRMKARVLREDYLTGESRNEEMEVQTPGSGGLQDRGVTSLPALVGNALFRTGYAKGLGQRQTPVNSTLASLTETYTFTTRVSTGRAKAPLTGKVPATRVVTSVRLQSTGQESAPFTVWFTDPEDLPDKLKAFCKRLGIESFPTAMRLDFSLGSLLVLADGVEEPALEKPPAGPRPSQ
ncbi:MAG: hypothetical protein JXR37_27215 [Kiritimatiellae bacterium]|nr:hypothetical protein [Kiritimatiellia bacterium]